MKQRTKPDDWMRRVVAFLASQCITLFGSSIVQMAIIWYVTLETSSGIWVTALTLASSLPQMLISFFSGVWADRYSRKLLIILADGVIAAATLGLSVFLVSEHAVENVLPAIIAVSIIRSFGAGVQTPAVNAMIPQLVPEEQLMRFNGINGSIMSMVQFAAPAAAGAILAFGSLVQILYIDVITAVIGIAVLSFIRIPQHKTEPAAEQQAFFAELKAGIRYCVTDKFIGRVLLIYGAFIFLCVPSGFLVALMIERTFGSNVWYLSVNEMVGCAGMVLGGLLLGTWGGFANRNKTFALGMIAYAVFSILLGFTTHFVLFVILMFCVSFFIPVVQTASMTMLQEKAVPEMQGRVFGLLNVMFSGFMPLGMAVFGPMADFVPIGWLMIGTGGIIALIGVLIPGSKAFYRQGMAASVPDISAAVE